MCSINNKSSLCFLVGSLCFIEGVILSMPPVLYPEEARARSIALPMYTSVFGVEPLASFLFAPFLSRLGKILGPYNLFNCGNFAHSFCALAFGLIVLVQNASIFLFLSYLDRYLEQCNYVLRSSMSMLFGLLFYGMQILCTKFV